MQIISGPIAIPAKLPRQFYQKYSRLALHKLRLMNVNRRFPNAHFIFVLSPMRSGSTLLQHILVSSLLKAKGFAYSGSVESASSYYLKRVENLKFVSSKLRDPDQAFFLTYDQLVTDTKNTLNALSTFLELAVPLNPTYETKKWTGVLGIGDFSKNIEQGRIVEDTGSEKINLPSTTEKALVRAYGDAVKFFEERFITAAVK